MKNAAFSMEELFRFLDAGVSAFHSTAAAAAILEAEGYVNCPESAAWELAPGGKYYTTRNGSAVLAWRMPKGELTGWHAAASHSDSPTWRIKQFHTEDGVFAKAEVEGYGGMIMPSWFDRPLTVAGRLLVRTGSGIESRLVCPDRALACIPNLCIHFSRDLNNGMKYNPQVDLQPIFGGKGGSLKDVLAEEAGVKAEDILDADLVLATREKAVRMGLNGEYFMSGRIDDLECAYTTLWGFLQGRGEEEGRGDIWVMFDNEEVGSSSRQGAQGTLMADVLARIEESMGVSREQSIRARTNALVLSADNGHATHPNHPEKSDPANPVVMGGGVLLKYNARQTYTTSGFTGAAFTAICKKAGVPVQVFANRADVPGGSTLGNLLGHQILMPMVDIGLGQLAMHSAMETASCADAEYMAKAVAEYYNTPIFQPKDGEWKLACERSSRAVRSQPQRAAASGKSGVQPPCMAEREASGRAHRPPHRGLGRRALPPQVRRPAGRGSRMAGPCLGRGRQPGRAAPALLPERVQRHLRRELPEARGHGPRLPLLLLPQPAPCSQRAPHLGRQCHLPRHLPGSDGGGDR